MRPPQRHISPIEIYARHGNVMPSVERLERMHDQLSMSAKPVAALVAADMCLDLAVKVPTELKDAWLKQAKGHLDGLQQSGIALSRKGLTESYRKVLPYITLAELKKSELSHWQKAVHGQNTEETYSDYLQTIINLVPWFIHDSSVNSRVMEFMPILMGARAKQRNASDGWFGRLALFREDQRIGNMKDHHSNWDTGIAVQPNSSDFIKPPTRLQIKAKKIGNCAQQYEKSGVHLMTISGVGVRDVLGVLVGCIIEAGIMPEATINLMHSEPAKTAELDRITERMAVKIQA